MSNPLEDCKRIASRLESQLVGHLEAAAGATDASFEKRIDQLATAQVKAEKLLEFLESRTKRMVDLEAYRKAKFQAVVLHQRDLQSSLELKQVEVRAKKLDLEKEQAEHLRSLSEMEQKLHQRMIPVVNQYREIWKDFKTRSEPQEHDLLVQAALMPNLTSFFILKHLLPIDSKGKKGRTVLAHFVAMGRLDVLQRLLPEKPSLDALDERRKTLTYLASKWSLQLLRCVYQKKHLNQPESMGRTPLVKAMHKGPIENVRFLLEEGADLSLVDSEGNTVLHHAVSAVKDEIDMLELLKARGADRLFEKKNQRGLTPFTLALVLKKMVIVNWFAQNQGKNALHLAALSGRDDLVSHVHQWNKEFIHQRDASQMTPVMHLLASCQHWSIISQQFDLGATLSAEDFRQVLPRIFKSPDCDQRLNQLFQRVPLPQNYKITEDWNCFQSAQRIYDVAAQDFTKLLEMLHRFNFYGDEPGRHAIEIAISQKNYKALKRLYSPKHPPRLAKGRTVFHAAALQDDEKLLDSVFQESKPQQLKQEDEEGKSPFLFAVRQDKLQAAEWFRLKNAPLDLSAAFQSVSSVAMLDWLIKHNRSYTLTQQDWKAANNTKGALYNRFVQHYVEQNWTSYSFIPPLRSFAYLTLWWKY